MENANTRFSFRSPWFDEDDPLYQCNQLGSLDPRHCFARVATRILQSDGNGFEKVSVTCASLDRRWAAIASEEWDGTPSTYEMVR